MAIETFPLGPLETNCHVIYNGKDAVVIDPGGDMRGGLGEVLDLLKSKQLKLHAIICTHFHFDHIYGVADLHKATGAPVLATPTEGALLQSELGGGGAWGFPSVTPFKWEPLLEGPINFGSINGEIIATPGHTPGSASLYVKDMDAIFTGDVLFFHSVGRTDFPGGSAATLKKTLHTKIFILPPQTEVYPGHGPNTTVREEQANNPYLWL